MKKMLLPLLALPCCFLLGGCSTNYIQMTKDNMSEMTTSYFYGECQDFRVSLSSGEREEPYVYDGVSKEKCEFALINIDLSSTRDKESITFTIDGQADSVVVEYNPITSTFMADLEKKVEKESVISVKYGNTEISLSQSVKDFAIDCDKAIEVGVNEFNEEISSLIQSGQFKGECYLKILDKLTNNYEDPFWCFTIVDQKGNHLNCIIDVTTGEVLAKT